ncbi:MAG: hypothetical protein Q9226_001469 [Calogaya cf. arnoldii]
MAEDTNLDETSTVGLSTDDIDPNVYEGGFKTWECSIDLAKYLATQSEYLSQILTNPCTIVELGAGTALPSQLLLCILISKAFASQPPRTSMILADFNPAVLKLATIPNLLFNYMCEDEVSDAISGGNVEGFNTFNRDFQDFLIHKCNIEIRGISGSWGPGFSAMALPEASETLNDVLRLAGETIYSPSSTRAFTETLLDLLRRSEKAGGNARALVAAKRVYFGVGGSVNDFWDVLRELGGEAKLVWTTEGLGSGVGRCILEVTDRAKEANLPYLNTKRKRSVGPVTPGDNWSPRSKKSQSEDPPRETHHSLDRVSDLPESGSINQKLCRTLAYHIQQ